MRRANSEHDAFQPFPFIVATYNVQKCLLIEGHYFFKNLYLYDYVQIGLSLSTAKKISEWKCVGEKRTDEGNI